MPSLCPSLSQGGAVVMRKPLLQPLITTLWIAPTAPVLYLCCVVRGDPKFNTQPNTHTTCMVFHNTMRVAPEPPPFTAWRDPAAALHTVLIAGEWEGLHDGGEIGQRP